MDISGTYTLSAPREHVWSALQDPDTLRQTIPGCERLERADDGSYNVRLNVGVAAVKGVYDGKLRLTDLDPPARYRIVVDGKGLRGVLHGDGVLTLDAPDANTTIVSYQGTALLGGALAGVGNRLAGGAAGMLIKSYFAKLGETVGAAGASGAAAPTMAAAPAVMPTAPEPPAMAPAPATAMPEPAAMPTAEASAPAPAAPIMSVAPEPLDTLAGAMPTTEAPASAPPAPAPDVAPMPSTAAPAREPEPVAAAVSAPSSAPSASSARDDARQRSWWRRLFGR